MLMNRRLSGCAVWTLSCLAACAGPASAAEIELTPMAPWLRQAAGVDSGWLAGGADASVFSTEVRVPGAAWVRLVLTGTVLGGDEAVGDGALLRLTSLSDGAVQTMQASHLAQWSMTSAYFNGDGVRVELLPAADGAASRLLVAESIYAVAQSEAEELPAARAYCGTTDDRTLSDEGRVARVILPTGAVGSVFMIDDPNHTFVTSGQVAAALAPTGTNPPSVIEFHAPLTFPDGATLFHPPPEDQYAVDLTSVQRQTGGAGTGDSWGYFGALPNSTTSQTPYQAEGVFFTRATTLPAPGGQVWTYGNGNTQPPVFRTWSFVQKSEIGDFTALAGTRVSVRADLTSGDSGAAVVDEDSGRVIAISFDDGCTTTGGANGATAITHPNLKRAINHPLGVCVALVYSYPNGIPSLFHPSGGTIRVAVNGANGAEPQPGTGQFHYNGGSGWVTVPMNEVTPNVYDAPYPVFPCGTFVDYYFSAATTTGHRVPDQIDAPTDTFRSAVALSVNVIADLNFETAVGWDVQNSGLTDGAWELAVPLATGTTGAPLADFDGSGKCWLTDNTAGDSDVDSGSTAIRSPIYDLAGTSNAFVSYARWFTNSAADFDRLEVRASNNGGASYTAAVESVLPSTGWTVARFKISNLISVNNQMRFRFTVSDNPNNSRVEAGLDAFSIIDYICTTVACTKGDVDNNGVRDGRDVRAFVAAVLAPTPGSPAFCAADMDNDSTLEPTDDVAAFVNCLVNGVCP